MTRIITDNRIGRNGAIRVGCSAVIFDMNREKILLTKREDNSQWCLPSGGMEPGESAMETCVREVFEETGLNVVAKRLIGIYTSPHQLIEYQDRNKVQLVALCFEADVVGGSLRLSDETTDYNYFSCSETKNLDLLSSHVQRIDDAFSGSALPFLR